MFYFLWSIRFFCLFAFLQSRCNNYAPILQSAWPDILPLNPISCFFSKYLNPLYSLIFITNSIEPPLVITSPQASVLSLHNQKCQKSCYAFCFHFFHNLYLSQRLRFAFTKLFATNDLFFFIFLISMVDLQLNGRSSLFFLFDFPETLNTMELSFLINTLLFLDAVAQLLPLALLSGFSPLTISGGQSGPHVFPVYTCWLGDPISSYGASHHQCPVIRSPHT